MSGNHARELQKLYPQIAATWPQKEEPMKQIASALVKAQRAFGPALKTNTNPAFRSKYADLSACVEAVIDALNDNGIFLLQRNSESETGVTVETVFVHESGETMECGKLYVPAVKHDAQGHGSALTYARRYSLMSACGIAPEDDDGNAAVKRHPAIAASFKSSPTMDENGTKAIDLLEPEVREYIRDLAMEVMGAFSMTNGSAIEDREESVRKIEGEALDDSQKMAFWSLLDSKTRSAFKKTQAAMKETAAA